MYFKITIDQTTYQNKQKSKSMQFCHKKKIAGKYCHLKYVCICTDIKKLLKQIAQA